jgi:branched-chain amino acid transport system ATP-binding protein
VPPADPTSPPGAVPARASAGAATVTPTSGPDDGATLHVEDLTVRYAAVEAVRGIDLRVDSGEAVALLGPNGAGKTSTLAAISRLVASTGTVTFAGTRLDRARVEGVARMGLCHVPEGRRVFPNLTVHENIQVATSARAGRPQVFSVGEVYDLFPALAPLRTRAGWALSGGEQQMVAIARALVASPRMLLLDEPSLGLAPIVVDAVFAALRSVRAQVPILLVEQNTDMALDLCDRAYVLAEGKVVLEGPAADLRGDQALIDSYLGRHDLDS